MAKVSNYTRTRIELLYKQGLITSELLELERWIVRSLLIFTQTPGFIRGHGTLSHKFQVLERHIEGGESLTVRGRAKVEIRALVGLTRGTQAKGAEVPGLKQLEQLTWLKNARNRSGRSRLL